MLKLFAYQSMLFIFFFSTECVAQSDSTESTSDIINNILEESSEDNEEDSERYYEEFEYLKNNPVNLNTADIFELQKIPYIDLNKAKQIIDYRGKNNKIFSVNELHILQGFDEQILAAISPFVTVDDNLSKSESENSFIDLFAPGSFQLTLRNRLINNIQEKQGFKDNKFTGTPVKNYNRLQIKKGNTLGLNLLTEKDEGEKYFNDFYIFNFWIKDYKFIKSFVVGDYILEFGQGLSLWGPYSNSKGINAITPVIKRSSGIRAYASSSEAGFMRGIATSFIINNFVFSIFYSRNYLDANIDESNDVITSFKIDGYHRTESELLKKRNSRETAYGFITEYSIDNFLKTGIIFHQTSFNQPVKEIFNAPELIFNSYSFFYDLFLNKIELTGEVADDGKNYSVINNLQYFVSRGITFVTSFRYYSPLFNNLHGAAFGNTRNINNEIGFYTGMRFNTGLGRINFYCDIFKKPGASINNLFPSKGWDLNLAWLSKNFSNSNILFRYNYFSGEESINSGNTTVSSFLVMNKIRLEYKKEFERLLLKSRVEYVNSLIKYSNFNEDGFMFFQEIKFMPIKIAEIYFRIISFRINSFNTAIYEYENDLEGVFRSVALFGEGLRWYFMAKFNVLENLIISAKYAETYKPGEKFLGSGYSLIDGDMDNQISLQVDWQL